MKKWLKNNEVLAIGVFILVVSIIGAFIPLEWFLVYVLVAILSSISFAYAIESRDDEPQAKIKLTDFLKSEDS